MKTLFKAKANTLMPIIAVYSRYRKPIRLLIYIGIGKKVILYHEAMISPNSSYLWRPFESLAGGCSLKYRLKPQPRDREAVIVEVNGRRPGFP